MHPTTLAFLEQLEIMEEVTCAFRTSMTRSKETLIEIVVTLRNEQRILQVILFRKKTRKRK